MANKSSNAHLVDSHLVISVEDGDGHGFFVTLDPALIPDTPAMRAVAGQLEATRKLQGRAKKAKREGKDVASELREAASDPKLLEVSETRARTVGIMRAEIAREMCRTKLASLDRFKGQTVNDATVDANLPTYMSKYPKLIEDALHAKLAAGYVPTPRGEGSKKAATSVTVDASEL